MKLLLEIEMPDYMHNTPGFRDSISELEYFIDGKVLSIKEIV